MSLWDTCPRGQQRKRSTGRSSIAWLCAAHPNAITPGTPPRGPKFSLYNYENYAKGTGDLRDRMARLNITNDIIDLTEITSTPAEISEWRRLRKTRFLVDENIKPWAIHLMRRTKLDLFEASDLGLGGRDDQNVFAACWQLGRFLVTHDADYLDDTHFPYNRCAGLMVFPEFGRRTLEFSGPT